MASILEASRILGVSPDTVYKRIKDGSLEAVKVKSKWDVHLKEDTQGSRKEDTEHLKEGTDTNLRDAYVNSLLDRIKSLEVELEARRLEVLQLHSLIQQKALPAPRVTWWQRLLGK